jgi:hypothetical protein
MQGGGGSRDPLRTHEISFAELEPPLLDSHLLAELEPPLPLAPPAVDLARWWKKTA